MVRSRPESLATDYCVPDALQSFEEGGKPFEGVKFALHGNQHARGRD